MMQIEAVKSKLDVVKSAMKDNIQQLLVNEEKLGNIETASGQLSEQSKAFRNSSKTLAEKKWWQMCKTRLLIVAVVIGVLLVIILPIVLTSK